MAQVKDIVTREIKFRGKTVNGDWVTGNLSILKTNLFKKAKSGSYISNDMGLPFAFQVRPETVGQFTGLHDKTGVEIYEGDIITVGNKYPKIIKYMDDRACFCMANIDDLKYENWKDIWQQPNPVWWNEFGRVIEVVGNIYDNPELLNT